MDRAVWVGAGDGEPAWALGGTYVAVRLIRMFVERWDRTSLAAQERVMGRRKDSGAPLDGSKETDLPRYADDPRGERIPLNAHIRLANPRTAGPEKAMLRRGFNYSRGLDADGLLDQGLVFVSYQRRLVNFLQAQERLRGSRWRRSPGRRAGASSTRCPAPVTATWAKGSWTTNRARRNDP